MDELKETVVANANSYRLPAAASQTTVCRYAGTIEGMLRRTDELYRQCGSECAQEGEVIGKVSAIAYCQTASSGGGFFDAKYLLQRPDDSCAAIFASSCGLTYDRVTRSYVNDAFDNPETPDVNEGKCILYTDEGTIIDPSTGRPKWEPIWNEMREIQCGQPD